MKTFVSIFVIALLAAAIVLLFIYSGFYNVSAAKPEGKYQKWLFETIMVNSVEHHAKDIRTPSNLYDPAVIFSGFKHFNRMCGCHGSPVEEASKSFNPAPPELSKATAEWKPRELFWIVKNGIKMSAMPTFKEALSDDEIWEVVAFLKKLPVMTEEEYKAFVERKDKSK